MSLLGDGNLSRVTNTRGEEFGEELVAEVMEVVAAEGNFLMFDELPGGPVLLSKAVVEETEQTHEDPKLASETHLPEKNKERESYQ